MDITNVIFGRTGVILRCKNVSKRPLMQALSVCNITAIFGQSDPGLKASMKALHHNMPALA